MRLIVDRQKRNPNIIVITTTGPFYKLLYKGDDENKAIEIINKYYDDLYQCIETNRSKTLHRLVRTKELAEQCHQKGERK